MGASWEVQKTLYTQLKNNSTFMNLIGSRLYDEPQTNNQYPYVTIGDAVENSDNDLSHAGSEVFLTFTIYTKPQDLGFYQAKTIQDAMASVLNIKKFSMDNNTMLICLFDHSFTDRDGDIRTISVRYKVLTDSETQITF